MGTTSGIPGRGGVGGLGAAAPSIAADSASGVVSGWAKAERFGGGNSFAAARNRLPRKIYNPVDRANTNKMPARLR